MPENPNFSSPSSRPSPPASDASPGEFFLCLEDVRKSLGPQQVLKGIDLAVRRGETMVVIGRSGGGKSVMLKHLIGLLRPDSGRILVDGTDITGLRERDLVAIRRKVGILFQSGALFDSLTVEENVAFPLREAGERSEKIIRSQVAEALEAVSLTGHGHKLPVALSGGMRKRVGLARAIISRPECILYDEPTAGLDPVVSDSIDILIRRMQSRFGLTSLVVTHDMKSAATIGDRVAYLHEGRIYFCGTIAALQAADDELIQDFIYGRSHETV